MTAREYLGSWLGGGPAGGGAPRATPDAGLPAAGPGAQAPMLRRVAALAIDWALCSLIAYAFLGEHPLLPVAVLAVENLVLVATVGHTLGHRLLGIQVRRAAGTVRPGGSDRPSVEPTATVVAGMVGFGRAAVRTALLLLVIPAVIWGRDGRGLHDRAAGTVIVRR